MRRAALALAALAAAPARLTPKPRRPKFRWPLIGELLKAKDGAGIDIAAREGEPVHAAGDGEVIYASDELASYGRMIVIRHADDYVTTYAHLSDMAAAKGDKVKRGQIIGKAGKTGDAKTPALHFELRKGDKSLAPVGYLSPR